MEKEYVYPAVLAFGYDGGRLWVANLVDLSGCWVEGEDREDVIKRAPEVLKEYLDCCIQAEWPIPIPSKVEDLEAVNVGEVITVKCRM
ncbi:MAG: type II toxin-antitoxin system HicB family antitoxin [Synergistaceae bacterium]|nr:type II toxin-antitoxin system HicB family antitoxin [Synergistaceae bacterium]